MPSPSQSLLPSAHVHSPSTHCEYSLQALLQAPQCAFDVFKSTPSQESGLVVGSPVFPCIARVPRAIVWIIGFCRVVCILRRRFLPRIVTASPNTNAQSHQAYRTQNCGKSSRMTHQNLHIRIAKAQERAPTPKPLRLRICAASPSTTPRHYNDLCHNFHYDSEIIDTIYHCV